MRDTLLRTGLYFGRKKFLLSGRALVWLGKYQMGFWFSNSADGKEKSDRLHLGSLSPFLLRKFFWTCIEQKRSKKYCVISALWKSLSSLRQPLPWYLPEWWKKSSIQVAFVVSFSCAFPALCCQSSFLHLHFYGNMDVLRILGLHLSRL